MDVLSNICKEAGIKKWMWTHHHEIKVEEGNHVPILSKDRTIITVGNGWFSDEQWAELMVLRLNNEVVFSKGINGHCFCILPSYNKDLYENLSKIFAQTGVKSSDAADSLRLAAASMRNMNI